MNILFLTDHYTPTVNGIVEHVTSVKQTLKKRGHRVYVVAPKARRGFIEKEEDVFRLPTVMPFPLKPPDILTLPFDYKIEKQLMNIPIDVIHSHLFLTGILGMRIAQRKNIPQVATLHTLFRHYADWSFPWAEKNIKYTLTDWFTRSYFERYDTVIAPSTKAIDSLLAAKVKAPIRLIYNGIDLNLFQKAKDTDFFKNFKVEKNRPIVVVGGRIDKGKNIDLAVKSISLLKKHIPDIFLVIMGDGTLRKDTEKLIKKLGLSKHVLITGFVDKTMVASINKAANVALFTSDTDTLSTVLIETAAAGKPIVAVYDKAVTDIVGHEKNGLLVPKDSEAIANALMRLFSQKKLIRQYGIQSQNIGKEFSLDRCVDQLEELYRELIFNKGERKQSHLFSIFNIFQK